MNKEKEILRNSMKNIIYTFSAQGISLVLSIFRALIIPKAIGLDEYSFWQLFLFYISFVGFFHFGFIDGIYLKYGGKHYESLDKKLFRSQFLILFISQLIIALVLIFYGVFNIEVEERLLVTIAVAISLLINNLSSFFWYIFQCTGRFKEYAKAVTIDKALFLISIVIFLIIGIQSFEIYIIAYLITTLISLSYCLFIGKDIWIGKLTGYSFALKEAINNISIGIKLMLANISGLLIIGTGRYFIDREWGITAFGQVSFSLSMTSILLLFINATSMVLFPALRQTQKSNLVQVYKALRLGIMVVLTGMLILYLPLQLMIDMWLPDYNESLTYLILLFPLCIYDGKMQILVSTYLKVIRKENILLYVNLFSLFCSVLFTIISAYVLHSVNFVLLSMVIGVTIRCIIAEIYISRKLSISVIKSIIGELILTLTFITFYWYIGGIFSFCIYLVVYLIILYFNKNEFKDTNIILRKII